MNGKKAKRFRAAARTITTAHPGTEYVIHNKTRQIMLHPECTRKFYKEMKQGKRAAFFISDAAIAQFIQQQQAQGAQHG